jgi:Zn finger protein HypA/HybF involved in hydrogenase expression
LRAWCWRCGVRFDTEAHNAKWCAKCKLQVHEAEKRLSRRRARTWLDCEKCGRGFEGWPGTRWCPVCRGPETKKAREKGFREWQLKRKLGYPIMAIDECWRTLIMRMTESCPYKLDAKRPCASCTLDGFCPRS